MILLDHRAAVLLPPLPVSLQDPQLILAAPQFLQQAAPLFTIHREVIDLNMRFLQQAARQASNRLRLPAALTAWAGGAGPVSGFCHQRRFIDGIAVTGLQKLL